GRDRRRPRGARRAGAGARARRARRRAAARGRRAPRPAAGSGRRARGRSRRCRRAHRGGRARGRRRARPAAARRRRRTGRRARGPPGRRRARRAARPCGGPARRPRRPRCSRRASGGRGPPRPPRGRPGRSGPGCGSGRRRLRGWGAAVRARRCSSSQGAPGRADSSCTIRGDMAPVRDNLWPEGVALLAALSPAMVALMDELPDTMFCAKDVTGRYAAVNPVFVARTNERSRRAVLGRRARDLVVPQLAERYEQQDAEVLQGRSLRGELERIRRLGGTSGWFLTSKLPVHDDAGRLVGIVSVSHDLRAGAADDATMGSMAALVAAVGAGLGARWAPARRAGSAGATPAVLDRRVRRVYGLTPRQLVLRTRVDHATRLLAGTTRSIGDVAADSGFYDQPSFT